MVIEFNWVVAFDIRLTHQAVVKMCIEIQLKIDLTGILARKFCDPLEIVIRINISGDWG